jgi:4-alpha-glucanotransferase
MPRARALDPPSHTSALHALADRAGILSEYRDQTGRETRVTTDETRVALLAALGIDASTDDAAQRALDELERATRDRLLDPVRVVRQGTDVSALALRLPPGWMGDIEWRVETRDESDRVIAVEGSSDAREFLCRLPQGQPPVGYYTVDVRVGRGSDERRSRQALIVVPHHAPRPRDVLGPRRVFGIIANLYSVRAPHDYGVGDLTTLGELLEWAGELGAEFVGVNPLHALRNRGSDISPYGPVSRLWRNPLYLDVEAIPEFAESIEAKSMTGWLTTRAELAELRASNRVEYARIMKLKRQLLEALHRTFASRHRDLDTERGRAYTAWLAEQSESLGIFATWCALDDHFARDANEVVPWQRWPERYRDPRAPDVAAFREANREQVDFHRWLQFELDRQLGAAAARGKSAGLAVGLYPDLAIGSARDGADSWMFRELFVEGASIGAPPDLYAPQGQNWGLPPLNPHRLRDDAYRYWIRLVRANLRHAGALRVDHVMGLFRQFWIPSGMTGEQGAYIRFPAADLLGILALEATRAGALVVGEDLGTVPPEVPPAMREWGLLSSDVLYFERDDEGGFKPADSYDAEALTTANTHDMATLTGWWEGTDIAIRRSVGLIGDDEKEAEARAERERERAALCERLAAEGIIPSSNAELSSVDLRAAVHELLCRTNAALVGFSLDDLAGERDPVNVPGVSADVYPSWTRRMTPSLPQLRASRTAAAVLRCEERRARR